MDLNQFKEKTVSILQAGADAGTVSALLTELVDMATVATAEIIQLQAALEAERNANDTLRQANMDLFLKIPVTAAGQETQAAEQEEEKPSFDSLFENGKLI